MFEAFKRFLTTSRGRHLGALALLTFSLFLFYANSFDAAWHYDDFHHIVENINIRKISNIPLFFTDASTFSRNPQTAMYRPLLMVTHAINYAIGFYNVVGYHVLNFAFHLITVLAFFYTALFLFGKRVPREGVDPLLPASFAALLFGLHTINTETVVYVSSRSAGMSTMFVALALLAYLKATETPRVRWLLILLSAASYFLGLTTKEIAITLPGMLLLYELLLNREALAGGRTPAGAAAALALRLAPYGAAAAGFFLLRGTVIGESLLDRLTSVGGTQSAPNLASQLFTQARVWVYYIRETLWPTSLSIDKPFSVSMRFSEPLVLVSLALLALILAGALLLRKRAPLVTFGALWFFITLLPETVFRLNVLLNDHRLYLPGLGAILAFTFVGFKLFVHFREQPDAGSPPVLLRRWAAPGSLALGLVALVALALVFLAPWLSTRMDAMGFLLDRGFYEDTLLTAVLACSLAALGGVSFLLLPGSLHFRLFAFLALSLLLFMGLGTVKRNMAFATEETIWKDVILKDPSGSVRGYNNLGIFYEQAGKLDLSIKFYNKTAQLAPFFPNAYINLGNVYHKKKDFERAVRYMKRAIELDPESALATYNLGNILREAGKEEDAIASYKESLRLNPRYIEAANNMANIFFKRGDFVEAIKYYDIALNIDPTFAMSYYNIGLAYENLGRGKEAVGALEQFLRYWMGDIQFRKIAEEKIKELRARVR